MRIALEAPRHDQGIDKLRVADINVNRELVPTPSGHETKGALTCGGRAGMYVQAPTAFARPTPLGDLSASERRYSIASPVAGAISSRRRPSQMTRRRDNKLRNVRLKKSGG